MVHNKNDMEYARFTSWGGMALYPFFEILDSMDLCFSCDFLLFTGNRIDGNAFVVQKT